MEQLDDIADGGARLWIFSTPRFCDDPVQERDVLTGFSESNLPEVLDLDGLLATLNELRTVRSLSTPDAASMNVEQLLKMSSLSAQVDGFFSVHANA
jgi:hypothetical protein